MSNKILWAVLIGLLIGLGGKYIYDLSAVKDEFTTSSIVAEEITRKLIETRNKIGEIENNRVLLMENVGSFKAASLAFDSISKLEQFHIDSQQIDDLSIMLADSIDSSISPARILRIVNEYKAQFYKPFYESLYRFGINRPELRNETSFEIQNVGVNQTILRDFWKNFDNKYENIFLNRNLNELLDQASSMDFKTKKILLVNELNRVKNGENITLFKNNCSYISNLLKATTKKFEFEASNYDSNLNKLKEFSNGLNEEVSQIKQRFIDRMLITIALPIFGLIVLSLLLIPYVYKGQENTIIPLIFNYCRPVK